MNKTSKGNDGRKKEKMCIKCKNIKNIELFYKNRTKTDGRDNCCNPCRRDVGRKYKQHRGVWNKLHRERIYRAIREYNERNPEKAKARGIFHRAILRGDIIRQPCMICGKENAHGHHDDYSKPLAVKWVCREHHEQIHTGELIC